MVDHTSTRQMLAARWESRTIKRHLGMLIMAVLFTSCATPGEKLATIETAPDPSVDFFNAAAFDKRLSSALRGHPPTVTVSLLAPTTVNAIPERLGTWLTMVEDHEGTIKLQPESGVQTRGLVSAALALPGAFMAIYQVVKDKILYGPVEDYNATIYYRGDGTISKVTFTRKEGPL